MWRRFLDGNWVLLEFFMVFHQIDLQFRKYGV